MNTNDKIDVTIITAKPIEKGHICKVTSARPIRPIESHPYIAKNV